MKNRSLFTQHGETNRDVDRRLKTITTVRRLNTRGHILQYRIIMWKSIMRIAVLW